MGAIPPDSVPELVPAPDNELPADKDPACQPAQKLALCPQGQLFPGEFCPSV